MLHSLSPPISPQLSFWFVSLPLAASSTATMNPFDDDSDAVQVIDVSQMPPANKPKPKVIKQEPKQRSERPPPPAPVAEEYVDPYASIPIYGYSLEDGEV